jgi:hypothetical protein
MTIAWAKYDQQSGTILSISWIKEDGSDLIEVEHSLAEKFILGEIRLFEYQVKVDQGVGRLEKIKVEKPPARYSSLKAINESTKYSLSISKKSITIKMQNAPRKDIILYATMKDDPSWLVKSWNISPSMVKNNKVNLKFADAQNYSYYMRSIDET